VHILVATQLRQLRDDLFGIQFLEGGYGTHGGSPGFPSRWQREFVEEEKGKRSHCLGAEARENAKGN
jgi:hypothetical protein